jgi:Zn-finger protein
MRPATRFLALLAFLAALLLVPAVAFGYNEGGTADATRTSCVTCHAGAYGKGPHGGYSMTTTKCQTCHQVHSAGSTDTSGTSSPASVLLLPAATVSGSCETCHDGTGGGGVYGAIEARGLQVGAAHRIDTTTTVPGGDPASGGSATGRFTGPGGTLSCDDCHSPHDADTVEPFASDRLRTADSSASVSDRLLRRQPTGAAYPVDRYGSDWCSACHKAFPLNGGTVHNHPVETSATTGYYTVQSVPSVTGTDSLATTMAPLGGSNYGYVMPDPRTPQQQGHKPLCQQCHGNSRSVGTPGDAVPFSVTAPDGSNSADNPRFQSFPHETVNPRMTVETGDDLCTNCHKPANLP